MPPGIFANQKHYKNMNTKYKCIVADLDGTLLRSDKSLSQKTKSVIEELASRGIEFVPATGRSFYSMPKELLQIENINYAITSNGVSIYDVKRQTAIFTSCLPKEFVSGAIELLKDRVTFECYIRGKTHIGAKDLENKLIRSENPVRLAYLKQTRQPEKDIIQFMQSNINQIEGIDISVEPCRKAEVLQLIKERLPEVYITTSELNLLEISNADCGKHRGLERLCGMLNISPEEVIAFGDNNNDIEMLKAAGLGLAVANATEECKKAASRCIQSNDEDGVASAIMDILKN